MQQIQSGVFWGERGRCFTMLWFAWAPNRSRIREPRLRAVPRRARRPRARARQAGLGVRSQGRGHACPSLRAPRLLRDSASAPRGRASGRMSCDPEPAHRWCGPRHQWGRLLSPVPSAFPHLHPLLVFPAHAPGPGRGFPAAGAGRPALLAESPSCTPVPAGLSRRQGHPARTVVPGRPSTSNTLNARRATGKVCECPHGQIPPRETALPLHVASDAFFSPTRLCQK